MEFILCLSNTCHAFGLRQGLLFFQLFSSVVSTSLYEKVVEHISQAQIIPFVNVCDCARPTGYDHIGSQIGVQLSLDA